LIVDQGNVAGSSPTAGAAQISGRPLRIAAGLAACCFAPICAYVWAKPRDAESLGSLLVGLMLVTLPAIGAFLIGLARRQYLRFGVPFLLVSLVVAVPAVAAAAGGWPGGWTLGVAGAVVGALVGIASGWLVMRWTLAHLIQMNQANTQGRGASRWG
jgi:hypothetical protein